MCAAGNRATRVEAVECAGRPSGRMERASGAVGLCVAEACGRGSVIRWVKGIEWESKGGEVGGGGREEGARSKLYARGAQLSSPEPAKLMLRLSARTNIAGCLASRVGRRAPFPRRQRSTPNLVPFTPIDLSIPVLAGR